MYKKMKALKSLLSAVGLMVACCLFIYAMQKAPADTNVSNEKPMVNDYNVYALDVPDDLNFAGEPLP